MPSPQSQCRKATRVTAKGNLYLVLALALLLLAVALENLRPLALTVPLALMAGFSSLFHPKADLKVEREVEKTRAVAGDRVKVKLHVSSGEPVLVEVRDRVHRGSVERGSSESLLWLQGSEELCYEVHLQRRGVCELGPARLMLSDPLRLWEEEWVCGEPVEVYVLPKLLAARGLGLGASYTGVWPGEVLSKRSGKGYEFYGVREYAPGDELRRVNWRASARHGKLMVNERVEERVTDALIVVDAGLLGLLSVREAEELVDAEASLAASLALHLLRSGNRVGLVLRGRESLWLRPAFGKRQLEAILYALARLEPGEPAPLDYALNMLTPYLLKPNAEFIAITPLLDAYVAESIFQLAPNYSVLVVSPNPFPQRKQTAHRILEVERSNLIVKLGKVCRVVDWSPGSPLPRAARRAGRPARFSRTPGGARS
jgi:uncharacterized protein (DUF58 family)